MQLLNGYFYLIARYDGAEGNNEEFANRSSGAYIFRPDGNAHYTGFPSPEGDPVTGSIVDETYTLHGREITQVIFSCTFLSPLALKSSRICF